MCGGGKSWMRKAYTTLNRPASFTVITHICPHRPAASIPIQHHTAPHHPTLHHNTMGCTTLPRTVPCPVPHRTALTCHAQSILPHLTVVPNLILSHTEHHYSATQHTASHIRVPLKLHSAPSLLRISCTSGRPYTIARHEVSTRGPLLC